MNKFRFSIRRYLSVRYHLWRAKRLCAKARNAINASRNALNISVATKFVEEASKHMDKAEEILKSLKQ